MAEKRIGRQTPTTSYILPYEKTLSDEAVNLYELSGNDMFEWQRNVLNDIMSINELGEWVHIQFGFSVSRQNGKNEIIAARELWGLMHGERILHTAHRVMTAHKAWERLMALCEKAELPIKSSLKAKGTELIEIEGSGRIEFKTRTSTGGRGETFDLLIIDEAQEYTDDQEDALSYTVTSSKNPQTIMCGTPPSTESAGTVFPRFRKSVLSGESEDCGWAEWSVNKLTDTKDVEAWYETNPSLGLLFSERIIRAQSNKEQVSFNIERLGLWIEYNLKSVISEDEWDSLKIDTKPELIGNLYIGIKYNINGESVAMSVASCTKDGNIFIEAVDCRSTKIGNDWIIAFLSNIKKCNVVVDGASGQSILIDELKANKLKPPVIPKVADIIKSNSEFESGINKKTIFHAGQPSLRQIATNIEKRAIGSNGGFGYKSILEGADIALLDSVILAYWLCVEKKDVRAQKVIY